MTYAARNIAPAYARNARFVVQIEPYSLAPGQVGQPVFRPVVMSRHRSPAAARRALIALITGRDNGATEYLRHAGPDVALRYVARATAAPFPAYSAAMLRDL